MLFADICSTWCCSFLFNVTMYLYLITELLSCCCCPVVCLSVPHVSTCCVSMLFPPCPDSPDSAVQVLSLTGNTPESRSTKQNWRILGITHVWWRTRWEETTPLALLTSKAVSTDELRYKWSDIHVLALLMFLWLFSCQLRDPKGPRQTGM